MMTSKNPILGLTSVCLALTCVMAFSAIAQSVESMTSQIQFIDSEPDPPGGGNGTPTSSGGTGSRGNCLFKADKPPLTRLGGEGRLRLTTSDRPTFWVYVPYSAKEASSGEFVLQEGEDELYRASVPLPTQPGVVGVVLPAQAKALEVGKTYRWYFDVNCGTTSQATPASVTGIVKRVEIAPSLSQALTTAKTSLNRAASYAKHGIWYETLSELAQLRLRDPQNFQFKTAWIQLLNDSKIGLESVAQEDLAGILTASSPPK